MKKFFLFVTILLLISGYASAADFWHFGAGIRATGVMPRGNQYSNALGEGILLTFGDPDSRFTTQFELDNWSVNFNRTQESITFFNVYGDSGSLQTRAPKFTYSGLTAGFSEKYRTFLFSPRFSNYIVGGLGGYFLNGKLESSNAPYSGTTMRSRGFFSVLSGSAGLGFEGRLNDHVMSFVEGRYVMLFSRPKEYTAPDMLQGYLGIRYVF